MEEKDIVILAIESSCDEKKSGEGRAAMDLRGSDS